MRNPAAKQIWRMRKTQIIVVFLITLLLVVGARGLFLAPAPVPTPMPPPVHLNPYVSKAYSYKGQLHVHPADYGLSPEELEIAYRDAGYSFVSITQHSGLIEEPVPDPRVEGILHINGVEETTEDGHVVNIGAIRVTAFPEYANTQVVINRILADGAIPSLAHPLRPTYTYGIVILGGYVLTEIWLGIKSFEVVALGGMPIKIWNAITAENFDILVFEGYILIDIWNAIRAENFDVAALKGYIETEIRNPVTARNFDILGLEGYVLMEIWNVMLGENAESLWDEALTAGKEVWGIAVDDFHSLEHGDFDAGWVVVFADNLTKDDILNGLRSGNFYASQGPTLSISVSGNVIITSTGASSKFEWIGSGGTVLKTTLGTTKDTYSTTGAESYVRIRVTRDSDGLMAWFQPIRGER